MGNGIQKSIVVKINIGEMIFNVYLDNGFFQTETHPELLQFNHRHNHSNYEVQLIFKGSGVIKIEGESIPFDDKSAFLIFPGVYHVLEFTPGTKIVRRSLSFNYENIRVRQFSSTMREMNEIQALLTSESQKYYHVTNFPESIERYLEDANSELMEHRLFYHASLQSIFSCVLIKLFRAFEGEKEEKYSINEDEYDAMRIFTIEKFFDERHSEDVRMEDLANMLGVTVRHLDRVIKRFFGVSFREKLAKTRIEVAKDLLKNTDMSIFDISWKVGYGSTVSFSSAFKKYTGTTPGMFRKNFKNSLNKL
ncbi:MAG TPA: helix-turn-helix transcriptional regulator [Clostridiaceae bacterium]|nr:helix-turn-helix transcriptional regulator [Clostridiaceae bacterium]